MRFANLIGERPEQARAELARLHEVPTAHVQVLGRRHDGVGGAR